MSASSSTTVTRRVFCVSAVAAAAAAGLSSCSRASGNASGYGAISNMSMGFFFFVVQNEAVKRKAEQLGYELKSTDASFDSTKQFNDWNSLLLSKPAFLIGDAIDSKSLAPLAQKAQSQKIPVGIIDTPLTAGAVDFTIAFDNRRGGEMAAEKIVSLLKRKHGIEKGTVLNGYGALSSSAWNARKEGFDAVMARYPEINVISRPTDGNEAKARAVAGATLAEFPDLDAAHAPSDSITRGIVTALQSKGLAVKQDHPKHVILVSIDGEPQSLQWIKDGILDAEVGQDPVAYGEICVEMLTTHTAKGKDVPLGDYVNEEYYWRSVPIVESEQGPRCLIPPYYIDTSNVDDPRHWGNVVTQKWGMSQ